MAGKVFLVGAGPGDIDLLTVKALRLIEQAEIIFYDSLVNEEILQAASQNCQKVFVGKRFGKHSMSQEQINNHLLKASRELKTVIRLKGGDPFIFARGGEEITYLKQNQIEVEVVPGISAAMAAAASLQIPLTHRDFGQSVIFLSGYSKANAKDASGLPAYNWQFLANTSLTMVFYMGLYHLKEIARQLMKHGKKADTRIAIISNCTLPGEKHLQSTLAEIQHHDLVEAIEFPALVLVGNVIELAQKGFAQPEPTLPRKKRSLILLFHGAKLLENSPLPEDFAKKLRGDLQFANISYAFLTEKFKPNYHQVIKQNLEQNFEEIIIWPMFLLPGKHLNEDIPALVDDYQKKYPHIRFSLWQAPQLANELYTPLTNMARLLLNQTS